MNKSYNAQILCNAIRAHAAGLLKTPVRLIDTALILPHPFHAPKTFDSSDLEALSLRLRNNEERTPLTVRFVGSGKSPFFQLVSGEMRLTAYRIGSITPVPCAIVGYVPDFAKESSCFPSYYDGWREAVSLCIWLGRRNISLTTAADELGIAVDTLQQKLSLLLFSPDEQMLLSKSGLSASCAMLLLGYSPALREKGFLSLSGGLCGEKAEAYIYSLSHHVQGRIRDTRLFYNSIDKAVLAMRESGFSVLYKRQEEESATVLTISVEKSGKQQSCAS